MNFCYEYEITLTDQSITMTGNLKIISNSETTALAIANDLIKRMTPTGAKWELRSCKCTYNSDIQ